MLEMTNHVWKLSHSKDTTQDETHSFLCCRVFSVSVHVIVEAIDSRAHDTVTLVSAQRVHVPKLAG